MEDASPASWVFTWFDVAVVVVVVAFDGADMMIEEKRQWAGKAGSSYLGETINMTKHTAYIRRRRPLILFLTPQLTQCRNARFAQNFTVLSRERVRSEYTVSLDWL